MPKKQTLTITNHKAADQQVIEKRLVSQLGDRYVHANLIELRPNSYLISQNVRLPIFGRSVKPIERTDESMSRKGYHMMKDREFISSTRVFGNQDFGFTNAQHHKYVLDPVASLVMQHNQAAAAAAEAADGKLMFQQPLQEGMIMPSMLPSQSQESAAIAQAAVRS